MVVADYRFENPPDKHALRALPAKHGYLESAPKLIGDAEAPMKSQVRSPQC